MILEKQLKYFSNFSSLNINNEKSEVSWIGNEKYRIDKYGSFQWKSLTSNTLKILGIYFSYNKHLKDRKF